MDLHDNNEYIPRLLCGLLRSSLDDRDNEIIGYLFDSGMSLSEAATALGVTKGTVRHSRDRCLREMRQASWELGLEEIARQYVTLGEAA